MADSLDVDRPVMTDQEYGAKGRNSWVCPRCGSQDVTCDDPDRTETVGRVNLQPRLCERCGYEFEACFVYIGYVGPDHPITAGSDPSLKPDFDQINKDRGV